MGRIVNRTGNCDSGAIGRITSPLRHNGQPYSGIMVLGCAVCCMALLLAVLGLFGVVILIPISRFCWATLQRIDKLQPISRDESRAYAT
jgi:hypothetical protein